MTYFKVESGGVELRSIDVVLPSASAVTTALSSSSLVNGKGEVYTAISVEDTSIVLAVDTFSVTLSVEVAVTDVTAMELSLTNTFKEANSNSSAFTLFFLLGLLFKHFCCVMTLQKYRQVLICKYLHVPFS